MITLKVLELFAGQRCIGKAFGRRGHQVFSIDYDRYHIDIDWYVDIGTITAADIIKRFGKPDIIWASPDCTSYSIAAISHHRMRENDGNLAPKSDYAKLCDSVNRNVLKLISELNPTYWFIENPRGGLRKMDFMKGLPRFTVTYCQYKDERMKPTDIWTNHPNPAFKDAAYNPPPYFYGSGYIPTDSSSPYHDNTPKYAGNTGNPTASLDYSYNGGVSDIGGNDYGGVLTSTSLYEGSSYNTAPVYYDDGSIGKLYIKKLNKTLKVYEGETLENMKKGIGHFESTSTWDGNCAFAGHNRGAAAYFSFVKDLAVGDTITYTTKYGTRTYKVYNKVKIDETDYSGLGWSVDNIISLITCVENEPAYRWLVQASEVK